MSSDFNPYYVFLGIPPSDQPLDHYRLLSLERLESNLEIIAMAADRQMGHLQRYEAGEHGAQVTKLMNEVARARLCLLNPQKKAAYDQQLQAQTAAPETTPAVKQPPPLPRKPPAPPPKQRTIPVAQPKRVALKRAMPLAETTATSSNADTNGIVDATIVSSDSRLPPIQSSLIRPTILARGEPARAVIVNDNKSRARIQAQSPAQAQNPPALHQELLVNSLGMKLVLAPAGEFMMGSPATEPERGHTEFQHPVSITLPFYIGIHPVTQDQYRRVAGVNPSCFAATGVGRPEVLGIDTREFPVETVSWSDAVDFCRRLSGMPEERSAGRIYRLPTEAEWEYACRAGTTTVFAFGDTLTSTQANFNGIPYGETLRGPNLARPTMVGSYPPNAWGLYDLHGNVWEWCQDWFYSKHNHPTPGPTSRILRGGCWKGGARACRSACRFQHLPEQRNASTGFRVVVEIGN